ncbi:glycosyltransferase [Sediminibacterium ginsengisoli]|uniref:Glycosyltransferase involved in cell wall bisynthesis n=1 Tax=Sediminibacterium ginsengisoli TaxID=413434 RepID=A0A1T4N546_9BACT|nr:glycosyltransferase [Sediminibacterium ginsengisoli]SJZ74236.1 Glycosyltransferase involved in cell wall bisynthesis [Sediminibacterium ginsengisoli]
MMKVFQEQNDIIFLISGRPLPAMLDMAFYSTNHNKKVLVILLERGEDDLRIDKSIINFELITITVPYKTVDLKRIISIPAIYKKIKHIIQSTLKPGGIIFTASYDLLLFAYFIAGTKRYKIRHQVRDLHALQLSDSAKARFFIALEKSLLKRVEKLVVSSPEFGDKYYKKIFSREIVLLENLPAKNVWDNFKKEKSSFFSIGFIGILRYKPSLYQLVDAVEELNGKGIEMKVLFAGGGNSRDLKEKIKVENLFEIQGPYEYAKDIKDLYRALDLIYAVYDNKDRNCQLAMPNKFYESIITGIPILVASGTFIGKMVEQLGIGATVSTGDKDALITLLSNTEQPGSWYQRALKNLTEIDITPYYEAYEKAMKRSVLF